MKRHAITILTATMLAAMWSLMLGSLSARAQPPAAGAAIHVTHTKISDGDSERRTGRVTYRIDWVLTGAPPPGLTRFTRFEVCFHGFNGARDCTTVNGAARTATVSQALFSGAVPHGVPFASVTGFGPCEKSVTWTPTGETTQGQCPINSLRFAAPPTFVTTPGSPAQPIGVAASQINVPGLGVKVEWQSNAPFNNAVTLKGFTVSATIKLPVLERVQIERPGQGPTLERPLEHLQTANAQAGANDRTKTLSFGSRLRIGGSPSLEQARVSVEAEWRIEGRSH